MFEPVAVLAASAVAAGAAASAPAPEGAPLLWLLAGLLVLAGIAGTVVPLLPGAPLVFETEIVSIAKTPAADPSSSLQLTPDMLKQLSQPATK